MKEINILFVCHGNICRSPMAEFILKDLIAKEKQKGNLKDLEFNIHSVATSTEEIGRDTHRGTKEMLDLNNIEYSKRAARQITIKDMDMDYIIAMDDNNIRNINRMFKGFKVKKLLEYANINKAIADPWYTGNFDETYKDIMQGCIGLIDVIKKEQGK